MAGTRHYKDLRKEMVAHPDLYPFDIVQRAQFETMLLRIGGKRVVLHPAEMDIPKFLTRGRVWKYRVKMMVGRPTQCHANSSELYENNRDRPGLSIITGYALSKDGLWRQHTWLFDEMVRSRPRIIETTERRTVYFGFQLTTDEAVRFVDANLF